MFSNEDFPLLTQAPPPMAPKRVQFDNKTSHIARLESQLTQEEVEANRLKSEARMIQALSPKASPAKKKKNKRPPTPGLPLKTLTSSQLNRTKRFATSPAKDPTTIKRSDNRKGRTPVKGTDKPASGGTLIPSYQGKEADVNSPPKNSIGKIPPPTPETVPLEIRESIGERECLRERASLEGFPSFDSVEYDEKKEREYYQKAHEDRVKTDHWEKYKKLVESGQDPGPLDYHDWKEEAEQLEYDKQQYKRDVEDANFLEDCRVALLQCESEEEKQLTPEEQVLDELEQEERGKYRKKQSEITREEDDLHRREYRAEVLEPYRKEMESQVAWEFDDDSENISEPGEVAPPPNLEEDRKLPAKKKEKKKKEDKPKPDPLMFLKGRGRQPTKSKRRQMTVDGSVRVGIAEKPKTPAPARDVEPAPVKQWILTRTGLTPEEANNKKKKKTLIKEEWMESQEKLIDSLVAELAKQLKVKLKDALKEKPEAINVLLGDDVKAQRETVKIVLLDAIERKKTRDAKKAAAAERKAKKLAVAKNGASNSAATSKK